MLLRFAIIGCGAIAGRHAAAIAKIGKLEAVCDVDEIRAAKLAADYQCRYFLNSADLLALSELDVVVI